MAVALRRAQVGVACQHPHHFDASSYYLEQAGAKEVAQLLEARGRQLGPVLERRQWRVISVPLRAISVLALPLALLDMLLPESVAPSSANELAASTPPALALRHTRWCLPAVAAGANYFSTLRAPMLRMPAAFPTFQPVGRHLDTAWVTIAPLSTLTSTAAPVQIENNCSSLSGPRLSV